MSGRHEWLDLIDRNGPFLTVPVLDEAIGEYLPRTADDKRRTLRQVYEEWSEAVEEDDPQLDELHGAWIDFVLGTLLEFVEEGAEEILFGGNAIPDSVSCHLPEHDLTLTPDYALIDSSVDPNPLLLFSVYPPDIDLDEPLRESTWVGTPSERMLELCRGANARLGLVTNGERWMLLDAGGVTSQASWYARLWGQETETLDAFVTLLSVGRFYQDASERLPALLDRSLERQDEVTEALGDQVRRAVEVLIQALDRADADRNRTLLTDVDPRELYEAGLTVMMRLVFLLSAEERGLLLLDDERYEQFYAISSLRTRLRRDPDEILERRWDAWSRLLAIFRATYGGVEHEYLRMPALGGSLFDPDRFPFLEGRAKGTAWQTEPATPLPIDNRTVLLLLDAIQLYEGRTISYRGLDIEQLGYVYEGLLDHTVVRIHEPTVQLKATQRAEQPWITLQELEKARKQGRDKLVSIVASASGSSENAVKNALEKKVDAASARRLLTACDGDEELAKSIRRYFHVLEQDAWGYPLVYPERAFSVTRGEDRRQTGSHYTPKSLTEAIVRETLEPLVYLGPNEGKPRDVWELRSPEELLGLKICDPAMGSGAFLVQVCRWLGDRVVEAWAAAEQAGRSVTIDGGVVKRLKKEEPLSDDIEERVTTARRLIAEQCIYGVDINPLAVELAKLSIWLVTLAKGKPFGFLDHNLRSGDSLLGLHNLNQLLELHMDPEAGEKLHGDLIDQRPVIRAAIDEVVELRKEIAAHRTLDLTDVNEMAELNSLALEKIRNLTVVADALVGETLSHAKRKAYDDSVARIAVSVGFAVGGDRKAAARLSETAIESLAKDTREHSGPRRPFHWPLAFPEVFADERPGFDGIVGNPPFLGGQRITGAMGTAYRNYLVDWIAAGVKGSADLVAYFYIRAYELLCDGGNFGLLAVNTISQGDTRQVGLERLLGEGGATIFAAYPNEPWPGKASVVTSRVHIHKGDWDARVSIDGSSVPLISAFLSSEDEWSPEQLASNDGKSFQGTIVLGLGFTVSEDAAHEMLCMDPSNRDVLYPYINGKNLNSHPEQKPDRWVINFWDWPRERAEEYTKPFEVVVKSVKADRLKKKDRVAKEFWWQFLRPRPELYHAIGRGHLFEKHPDNWDERSKPLSKVLVFAQTSRTKYPALIPNEAIFDQKLVVIASEDPALFAVLCSHIHYYWAWTRGSSMKSDPVYTPTDVFETFPMPKNFDEKVGVLGSDYDTMRASVCLDRKIGLTKLYTMFHNPAVGEKDIVELRDLHMEMDACILRLYGWSDIDMSLGFHEVRFISKNDRVRYGPCPKAQLEILRRLNHLNRERFKEEQLSK